MRRGTVISVVNHKGGVLKTTSTVNLGAALARKGYKVLLIDLDAQQNLTVSLSDPPDLASGEPTLLDCLIEEVGLDALIRSTDEENLSLVPTSEDLATVELNLASQMAREWKLSHCLARTERVSEFDFILLDNPPSISLVVINALVASDYFLVPVSAEYLPMTGLSLLGDSIGRVQQINSSLTPLGVLLTLYSRNESICKHVESELRRELGDLILDTVIRVNTKAKSAPSIKKTIFQYEDSDKGRGSSDYSQLADEVLLRLEALQAGVAAVSNE